ncbi:MAG: hypothetical protein PHV81_00410 [Candidatus Methanomethylophilaceae archaeon]|jgi:hypothetical protein|nr:hypothetical protein [Candidatus Methanomethylophilaceae archaeon]MDD2936339.1 hypothetical protein [Candidatus Methanomethylophilaceae archaeon]MDD3350953.1 hypothetical protein [Candidatus Methanomethylophilaceae archaeon]MDD3986559.1 hypothetical protein [Candidatus Methanomethylophilaceae archaeon]MDD4708539.1 hypothetical protein [Candidatus Methanomethylophilaceae archaeon]
MDLADAVSLLGIFSALAVFVSIALLSRLISLRKNIASTRPAGGIATYFLDDSVSEKLCSICLGKIGLSPVSACGCGRIFHDGCASTLDRCPYCARPYGGMVVNEPERPRCPVCGRFLGGSICSCGAVFPKRDGTMECSCGNIVDCSRPLCGKCGSLYEKTKARPDRGGKNKT